MQTMYSHGKWSVFCGDYVLCSNGFLKTKMYLKQNQTTNGTQKVCFLENIHHLSVCGGSSKPSRLSLSCYPYRLVSVFEYTRAYTHFGILFPSLQKQQVGHLPGPSAGSFEILFFCWSVTYLFLKMGDTGLQQGGGEHSGLFLCAY